ncbi:MAG: nucleoside 2-deoxyribosyltransferase domain-containing protein [Pseudomonadota bacterium]|nr:nucleoside 2-deoxyribosyltransferase domain-containing protein [Pseudomonadota bacterium]
MRVYLSGPITGHNDRGIFDWRTHVKAHFPEIQFLDPADTAIDTSEEYLRRLTDRDELELLRFGKNVVTRNKILIQQADLLFANVLQTGAHTSIGTVGEIFLANAYDKPIIILRDQVGNVHNHAMLNAIAAKIVHTMDEAIGSLREFSGLFPQSKRA